MMWNYKQIFYLLILLVSLSACRQNEPEQQAPLQIRLCMPAQEMMARAPRRAIGDPGGAESFAKPRYAYIFVTRQYGDAKKVWKKEFLTLDESDWNHMRYTGRWETAYDEIYQCTKTIRYMLLGEAPEGKVFAICSDKKLTLTPSFESINTSMTEEELMELKFNTAPDSIQMSLKDIYITPYNYKVNNAYYCSYDCTRGNSYTVDLLLYHVAAKVDIKWNVVDSMRINKTDPSKAVRLTYMEARNLYNGWAYCFQPMRNTVTSMPTTGYAIDSIVVPANEGQWWEGRAYFYTIPYTVTGDPNYFPLQMTLRTNGSTGEGYQPTLKMQIDTAAMFVPWLRANFNLTKPLEDKTETITISVN